MQICFRVLEPYFCRLLRKPCMLRKQRTQGSENTFETPEREHSVANVGVASIFCVTWRASRDPGSTKSCCARSTCFRAQGRAGTTGMRPGRGATQSTAFPTAPVPPPSHVSPARWLPGSAPTSHISRCTATQRAASPASRGPTSAGHPEAAIHGGAARRPRPARHPGARGTCADRKQSPHRDSALWF